MPTAVKIHKATNSEVRTQSKVFNAATGDDVMPQDIKLYQDYAGKRISMEAQDVAAIKNFDLFGKAASFFSGIVYLFVSKLKVFLIHIESFCK